MNLLEVRGDRFLGQVNRTRGRSPPWLAPSRVPTCSKACSGKADQKFLGTATDHRVGPGGSLKLLLCVGRNRRRPMGARGGYDSEGYAARRFRSRRVIPRGGPVLDRSVSYPVNCRKRIVGAGDKCQHLVSSEISETSVNIDRHAYTCVPP
jgi:hypothetical protein